MRSWVKETDRDYAERKYKRIVFMGKRKTKIALKLLFPNLVHPQKFEHGGEG